MALGAAVLSQLVNPIRKVPDLSGFCLHRRIGANLCRRAEDGRGLGCSCGCELLLFRILLDDHFCSDEAGRQHLTSRPWSRDRSGLINGGAFIFALPVDRKS